MGLLAGSLVTSTHDSKEACEGRGVTLKEKGVIGSCMQRPAEASYISSGTLLLGCTQVYGNGQCAK